jgi:hypothetical protein
MVARDPALERLTQRRELLAQLPPGQLGQHLRIGGPTHQCLQHRPARDSQHVGGHTAQLDPGVLQHLVQPLGLTGALIDQRLAVAGQVAQLPDRSGWHEAGADQAALDQLGDPGRIRHIGLAAGTFLRCCAFSSQHWTSSSSR